MGKRMTKKDLIDFLAPFPNEIRIIVRNDSWENPIYKNATIKYKIVRITQFQKIDEQMKNLSIDRNEGIVIIK